MSRVSYDGNKAQIIVGYSPGRTDDRYPNFIKALKLQTDDCIAYSILIGQSIASEASPQTDEACGRCGSDRRFIDEFW
jgi:hypothetical protein